MTSGIALHLLSILRPRGEDLVRLLGDEPDAAVGANNDQTVNLALRVDTGEPFGDQLLHVEHLLHEIAALARVEPQQRGIAAVARGANVHLTVLADVDRGVAGTVGRRTEWGEDHATRKPDHVPSPLPLPHWWGEG